MDKNSINKIPELFHSGICNACFSICKSISNKSSVSPLAMKSKRYLPLRMQSGAKICTITTSASEYFPAFINCLACIA